jgi:hypothetical protein
VVHQIPQGVGVMFDAVTSEQRRTLRGWLFGHAEEQESAASEISQAVA